jgi:hypothetical protein
MRKVTALFAFALSAWLFAQPAPARADIPLGTINFPAGSTTASSDCFDAETFRSGEMFRFITLTATNFSGFNWDDFTITILTCPSGLPTSLNNNLINWVNPPPPSVGLDGGTPVPAMNVTVNNSTNTIHFDLPFNVPSGHSVSMELPYHAGPTTSQFMLKLDPSFAPEPSSAVLTAMGALGLFGWTWRQRKAREARRTR